VAYAVSAIAAALQLTAAWKQAAVPSPVAMRLLTYTFVALVVPLTGLTRGQPGSRWALWGGTLANVDLITKVSAMPGGTHVVILSNGQKLPVSRLQSRILRERFLKL
jgi:hypothetical protein